MNFHDRPSLVIIINSLLIIIIIIIMSRRLYLKEQVQQHRGILNIDHRTWLQCSSPNIRRCPSSVPAGWLWRRRPRSGRAVAACPATARPRRRRHTGPWCSGHSAGGRSRLNLAATGRMSSVPCLCQLRPWTTSAARSRNSPQQSAINKYCN